jgi:hypothetical protein
MAPIDLVMPPALWLPPTPAIVRAESIRPRPAPIVELVATRSYPDRIQEWTLQDCLDGKTPPGIVPAFFMPGFGAHQNVPSVSAVTTTNSTTNLTTYTFAGVSTGTARGDRVNVAAFGISAGAARTFSATSVNGVAATSVPASLNGTTNFCGALVPYYLNPTGTTGDIVLTMSGALAGCIVCLWAMYGADMESNLTRQLAQNAVGTGPTLSMTTVQNTAAPCGNNSLVFIAMASRVTNTGFSFPAKYVESYDVTIETNQTGLGAAYVYVSGTVVTIQGTFAASPTTGAMSAIGFSG